MQVTGLVAEQHGEIRVAVSDGLLELGNALDITELCLRSEYIFAGVSTKTTKDVSRLLLPTNLD